MTFNFPTLRLRKIFRILLQSLFWTVATSTIPCALSAQHQPEEQTHHFCGELPSGNGFHRNSSDYVDRFNRPWNPPSHLTTDKIDVAPRVQALDCGGFRVDFEDVILDNGIGFDDPTPINHPMLGSTSLGELRRRTLCEVFSYLGNLIQVSGSPDIIILESRTIPFDFIAAASPFFQQGAPSPLGGTLFDHITTGIDPTPGPGDYDALIVFNFGYSLHSDWFTSPGSSIDLYSIALHEILHTLGFLSLIDHDGQSVLGNGYSRYDHLLRDGSGRSLIDPVLAVFTGVPNDPTSNTITFQKEPCNYSSPVFSPSQFRRGSSMSHFDEFRSGLRYVMRWSTSGGEDRVLTAPEQQALCALGYRLRNGGCSGCGPFGNQDFGTTSPGEKVCVDVLANDYDPDNGTLQVDPGSVSIIAGGGSVTIEGNRICYTPPASFIGVAKLVYRPSDGSALGNSTNVFISVVTQHLFNSCNSDTLWVSTGRNPLTNMVEAIGTPSPFWVLTSDPEPGTVEPRVTFANRNHPGWRVALPESQWISDREGPANFQNGEYRYELRFCVGTIPQSIRLVIDVLADDMATVEINGTEVGATRTSYAFLDPPAHIDRDIRDLVQPGENRLIVRASNTGSVAAGIDVAGHIIADARGSFQCTQMEIGPDAEICLGQSTELSATGGVTYRWSPQEGLSCVDCANPAASPQRTITYHVRAINADGCSLDDSIQVTVNQAHLEVSSDTIVCSTVPIELSATSNVAGTIYRWDPARDLSCADCPNPVATPRKTTTYRVMATTPDGCIGVDSVQVRVLECADSLNYTWHLPSNCVGQTEHTSVLFNSRDHMDTIVDIRFIGDGIGSAELDTTLPIVIHPTRDMWIPILYRWEKEGIGRVVMYMETSSGKIYAIGIEAPSKRSVSPMFDLAEIHIGQRRTSFDTCITLVSRLPRGVMILDTAWIRTTKRFTLTAPTLPIYVGPGESTQLCFHFNPASSDTAITERLYLSGSEAVDFCPHCYYHTLVLDTKSGDPVLSIGDGESPVAGAASFSALPNPTHDELTVMFELTRPETLTLQLWTVDGRETELVKTQRFDAGVHVFPIDVESLSSGTYILTLSYNRTIEATRVVIRH